MCSAAQSAALSKSEKNLCLFKASSSRATGVAGGSCMPPYPSEELSSLSSREIHLADAIPQFSNSQFLSYIFYSLTFFQHISLSLYSINNNFTFQNNVNKPENMCQIKKIVDSISNLFSQTRPTKKKRKNPIQNVRLKNGIYFLPAACILTFSSTILLA